MNTPQNLNIQEVLKPDEVILWQGKPLQGLQLFQATELKNSLSNCCLVVIIVMLFIVKLNVTVFLSSDEYIEFGNFTLMLIVIPMILYSVLFSESSSRAKIQYAVTNTRLIIFKSGDGTIKSTELKSIVDVYYSENKDGSGKITFVTHAPFPTTGGLANSDLIAPVFKLIPDVRNVYTIIQNARKKI